MRLHASTFNCKPFSDRPFNKMILAYDAEFKDVHDSLDKKLSNLMIGSEVRQVVNTTLQMYNQTKLIMASDKFT